jgi:hypothetical protein
MRDRRWDLCWRAWALLGLFAAGPAAALDLRATPKATVEPLALTFAEPAHKLARVASFAEDAAGELYVLDFEDGEILRFDPVP